MEDRALGAVTPAISTHDLRLSYGATEVLRGVDVAVPPGGTLALLGPSGCGKTTLLRLVAGLLSPSSGEIAIEGRVVAGPGRSAPPEARGLGMVFQDYALWPHLSVAGNVAFPLEMAGTPRGERERRVAAALERVGLAAFAGRSPSALSGGQQQRVAIARAIVGAPRIVLFDEPLSNLDRELRETMVAELGALIRGLGLTAIYVTHDQSEALTLADEVAVMDAGRIVQLAAPEDLVERPASAAVAAFLRLGAILPLTRVGDGWSLGARALGPLSDPFRPPSDRPEAARADVLAAPRALRIAPAEEATLRGQVVAMQYRDMAYVATIRLDAEASGLTVQIASDARMRLGERIGLEIVPERLRWFPARTQAPAH
ncbi:ABC transporter ATP-binding protein [Rubrimonas sp.]|uniref:ABC transporter ATP-binding protein n=1 Tax=Rubrimonas sp. TaxID=2036015 RepID=UPI002FDE9B96